MTDIERLPCTRCPHYRGDQSIISLRICTAIFPLTVHVKPDFLCYTTAPLFFTFRSNRVCFEYWRVLFRLSCDQRPVTGERTQYDCSRDLQGGPYHVLISHLIEVPYDGVCTT
jgi:hypothetical protein